MSICTAGTSIKTHLCCIKREVAPGRPAYLSVPVLLLMFSLSVQSLKKRRIGRFLKQWFDSFCWWKVLRSAGCVCLFLSLNMRSDLSFMGFMAWKIGVNKSTQHWNESRFTRRFGKLLTFNSFQIKMISDDKSLSKCASAHLVSSLKEISLEGSHFCDLFYAF